ERGRGPGPAPARWRSAPVSVPPSRWKRRPPTRRTPAPPATPYSSRPRTRDRAPGAFQVGRCPRSGGPAGGPAAGRRTAPQPPGVPRRARPLGCRHGGEDLPELLRRKRALHQPPIEEERRRRPHTKRLRGGVVHRRAPCAAVFSVAGGEAARVESDPAAVGAGELEASALLPLVLVLV